MKKTIFQNLTLALLITFVSSVVISLGSERISPIADAGLSRYAAQDSVVLDGTGSYDPDESGQLSYDWQQLTGPSLVITNANTATPTISGFVQTDEIQECEFELVVSDGELESRPDTVKVIIVPDFGENMLHLTNESFDPNKPTYIFFQGGSGGRGVPYPVVPSPWSAEFLSMTNTMNFHKGYAPDIGEYPRTYYDCGDMIIVYLSSVAPDYKLPIQTLGASLGGQPAVDVGIRLNATYQDARYAVNRVTFLDASTGSRGYNYYSKSVAAFVASSVDGEQCWLDNYVSKFADFYPNVLNVGFKVVDHTIAMRWYDSTWKRVELRNNFNHGLFAGVYWHVIGPGKNLQLASTPGVETYKFIWYGDVSSGSGYMDFWDEPNHPGRLPESVTLVGPESNAFVGANGAVFSCEESENAVGYQLLFGPDPYHMVYLFSDTPFPPSDTVNFLPFERTWWTIKAYDQYGSTIYADPLQIAAESVSSQMIENVLTGQRYASIQQAMNDAHPGDEIVVGPGTCHYLENINFKGKNLVVRSMNPNDPAIVAATVINGGHRGPVVTLSSGQGVGCVLAGLTITGGTVGISCSDASPTIRNCIIQNTPISIEFLSGYEPIINDCTILGSMMEVDDPNHVAHWKLDETEGAIAYNSAGDEDAHLFGDPQWRPDEGKRNGALELDGINDYVSTPFILDPSLGAFSVLVWIKGGAPGQVVISQSDGTGTGNTWLGLDAQSGNFMTELVPPRAGWVSPRPLVSESTIIDNQWHHIGFTWDSSYRALYVDGIEVARDLNAKDPLKNADGGLHIGASKDLDAGTFFSGLIDDVRIYDQSLSAGQIAALAQ